MDNIIHDIIHPTTIKLPNNLIYNKNLLYDIAKYMNDKQFMKLAVSISLSHHDINICMDKKSPIDIIMHSLKYHNMVCIKYILRTYIPFVNIKKLLYCMFVSQRNSRYSNLTSSHYTMLFVKRNYTHIINYIVSLAFDTIFDDLYSTLKIIYVVSNYKICKNLNNHILCRYDDIVKSKDIEQIIYLISPFIDTQLYKKFITNVNGISHIKQHQFNKLSYHTYLLDESNYSYFYKRIICRIKYSDLRVIRPYYAFGSKFNKQITKCLVRYITKQEIYNRMFLKDIDFVYPYIQNEFDELNIKPILNEFINVIKLDKITEVYKHNRKDQDDQADGVDSEDTDPFGFDFNSNSNYDTDSDDEMNFLDF